MEELDDAFRSLHERIEQVVGDQHCTHGDRAVGQTLGAGQDVRRDAPALRGEGLAHATEAGDDLIEDQQDAVLGGDLAQPLQIAHRRQDDPGRAGHRLDDHRGDVLRAMQHHQPFQFIGALHAVLRQAAAEGIALQIEGVRQVIDTWQHRAEGATVVGHAADRHAAETDAMIGQLAANQPRARALTDGALIGQGDLQRGIRRFRSGVGEEHPVQAIGADGGELLRQLEGQRMAHLEGRSKIHLGDLLAHRLADFASAMAGIAAPEAGGAVEHLAAVARRVIHALGTLQQARRGLELAVGGEGHPEVIRRGVGMEIL